MRKHKASKSVKTARTAPSYVIGDMPRRGQEFILYSTKVDGIDIVVNVEDVFSRVTLTGDVKNTVKGYTDRGQWATIVLRDSETGSDDKKVLSIDFE